MKKLGRILSLFLMVTMLVSLVTGCSSNNDNNSEDTNTEEVITEKESDYPNKTIKIIVPYSAGGSSDIGARMVAKRLEEELGQTVIVENISGAAGYVGWTKMMQEAPDGYTIALFTLPYISGYLNPENKRTEDLDRVTTLVNHVWDTTAWAVKPDSQFKDLNTLLEYVKENPGAVKVGTSGAYTQHHIAVLELEKLGYKMEAVHTGGLSDSLAMVLGGHIDIASLGAGDVMKQANEGALVPLAVLDAERSEYLPDTPTFEEASGLEITAFAARGFAGPAGMPEDVIETLNNAFEKIMKDPEHIEEMKTLGLTVKYMDTETYNEFLKEVEQLYKEILGW